MPPFRQDSLSYSLIGTGGRYCAAKSLSVALRTEVHICSHCLKKLFLFEMCSEQMSRLISVKISSTSSKSPSHSSLQPFETSRVQPRLTRHNYYLKHAIALRKWPDSPGSLQETSKIDLYRSGILCFCAMELRNRLENQALRIKWL